MKDAEEAIEQTVKKWDPAKDPHIEVHTLILLCFRCLAAYIAVV